MVQIFVCINFLRRNIMKEKIRKGLSLILALLMIMSVVPFNGIGLSHLGIEAIAVQNTVV